MTQPRKSPAFFPVLFGIISLLFISILVYVYIEVRKANPVILDEHGQVRGSQH